VLLVLTQTQALGARRAVLPLAPSTYDRQVSLQTASLPPVTSVQDTADGPVDATTLLREALPRYHIEPEDVPAFFRQQVHKRLSDYTESARTELQVMLQRAAPYLPSIKLMLKQQNVPSYFAYVPLVESAFQIDAGRSESGARGLWQLVPETARTYGLRVSRHVDDRLDPLRATRAASHYLRELQQTFGPDAPLLVLAAYHFGENNLSRAIMRARTRDIWSLMRQGQIPYRTRDFLVKMVSLWVAITHAERFQLVLEVPQNPKAFVDGAFSRPASLRFGVHQEAPVMEEAPEMGALECATPVLASSPFPGPVTAAEAYTPTHVEAHSGVCCRE
jgi:soluble lytic murein transglycosylase-like protein